jgi:hypothetical protein
MNKDDKCYNINNKFWKNQCNKMSRESQIKYYSENKEKIMQIQKKYRKNNK